ncbi:MAG: chemotaxis protein CheW [Elainellaceae cyanobacterium]
MEHTALAFTKSQSQKATGDAHLKFQLGQKVPACFSMDHVQEAIVLPAHRLTPIPNMSTCLLGLMNRRSRVVWVVDLALMLGISRLNPSVQQYSLVMIQVGSVPLGLAVQRIEGIRWIQKDVIQSPLGQVTPALVPYLRGCVLQPQEIVLVLDAEAIVQSPILQQY